MGAPVCDKALSLSAGEGDLVDRQECGAWASAWASPRASACTPAAAAFSATECEWQEGSRLQRESVQAALATAGSPYGKVLRAPRSFSGPRGRARLFVKQEDLARQFHGIDV